MFKKPSHLVFNYQPLHYDEKKEKMEERKKKAKKESVNSNSSKVEGSFKLHFKRSTQKKQKESNIRLLVILGFFGLMAYYLLIYKDLIGYMLKFLIPEK